MEGDLAEQIVGGIDTYLDRLLADAPKSRARYRNRDLSSPEAYVKSVETNRQHLAAIMGVVDKREPVQLEFSAPCATDMKGNPAEIGRGKGFKIFAVTWNVFAGSGGRAVVGAGWRGAGCRSWRLDRELDAEQIAGLQALPAASQFARRLAEAGCRDRPVPGGSVLIAACPECGSSGSPERAWRAAYEWAHHPGLRGAERPGPWWIRPRPSPNPRSRRPGSAWSAMVKGG